MSDAVATETDEALPRAPNVENAKRIVLKLGTNTLCDPNGLPDRELLRDLAAEMHLQRSQGRQFIVVTSGAIGCGRNTLKLAETPQDVAARQACAAIGQHRLMAAWDEALARHRVHAAQILVTRRTFQSRQSYQDLRACIEAVLTMGAVPVVNGNDSVCTDEIDGAFGDNDALGALVASKADADLYVILSDVPCLYTKPPHMKGARPVHHVERVTDEVIDMADVKVGRGARSGMRSKLECARTITEAGVPVVIVYGREPAALGRILAGEQVGTWFDAVGQRDARGHWLMSARPQGRIDIDAGAVDALRDGKQLLPAGIRAVDGDFAVESVVEIMLDGTPVARAVSAYSSRDLATCMGRQSDDVRRLLEIEGPVNITRKGRIELL